MLPKKEFLRTAAALVGISTFIPTLAPAAGVIINGSDQTVATNPNATPAITFATDNKASVNGGVNITGTVVTNSTNTGTLSLLGTTTVSGAVGAGASLKVINAGANGATATFSSSVGAQTINVTGTGTITFQSNTTGALAFGDGNGTVNNNGPGLWTGDVLSNSGAINNNSGARWVGNIEGSGGGIVNNIGATWIGSVVNTGHILSHGAWSGNIVSDFFGDIRSDGAGATWTGNVLTNDSQIVNLNGSTWTGNVYGNNNVIFNLSSSFWNGDVVADGGGSNSLAQIDNYGTWTGKVDSNAAEINNIAGNWIGAVLSNAGAIVNNYNDAITNVAGINHAVWTGDVANTGGEIVNDRGGRWNGNVLANNNVIFNQSGATWSGDVVANGGGSNSHAQIDNLGAWNGAVDDNAGAIYNFSGSWTGAVAANAGTIVNNRWDANLNPLGVNHAAWTGNVTTNNGTILNQAGGSWIGNVLGNAAAITNNATWIGDVVSNGGTLTNNLTWIGAVANAGTFNNNAGATLSGLLINSGTTNNAGVLGGGLTNTAGVTLNTGTIGGVTTVNGGTLTGNGTTANLTVGNGGTFAPGTPGTPGTAMTVAGNLAFQSGALYAVQLNSAASLARVSGTAALAGTVQANFAPAGYVPKQYTILTAAGGLGGTTFAGLANSNLPPGLVDSLSYDASDVYLNLTPGFTQITARNGNQQAVANALTSFFNRNGGIPAQFVFVSQGGLTQLDGEAATGAEGGAFAITTQFLNLMLDPFVDGRSGPGGSDGQEPGLAPNAQAALPPDIALGHAGVLKAPPPARFAPRWTAWGGAFGGRDAISGDPVAGSSNVVTQAFGVAGGMDYQVSADTVLGFALAGGGTSWGLSGGLGGGRSDAFQAGGYGITHAGPAYLAGAVSFTNHWLSTNRTALGDQLTGRFQGQGYGARLEGGYRFAVLPRLGVTHYAAVQGQQFATPSFGETDVSGGGFGLNYASMRATDVRSELGLRLDDSTTLAGMPLILRGRVAFAHDTVRNPALGATFEALPGASFIVTGAPIPKNSALTSAGAQLFMTKQWSLLGKFDGEFAKGARSYAGSETLRYAW
jgi:uncharacterized protein with beta-barrel porin domain